MQFVFLGLFIGLMADNLVSADNKPVLQPGDVTFDIATRQHPDPIPLTESDYDTVINRPTVIQVSGWMHNTTAPTSYFPNITAAYLEKGNYNVILVHADKLMFFTEEQESANYTEAIGKAIADLIEKLHQRGRIFLSTVHIVGHGLGAHIAGATGRIVFRKYFIKIYRITAMEISEVGFENVDPSKRLDKSDAVVVDVIHTAAGQVGLNESVGSADFWPNGGVTPQPGCSPSSPEGMYCSHDRSIWYFIDTLRTYPRAVKCNSYANFEDQSCANNPSAVFGDNYSGIPRGNFYLYLVCNDETRQCNSSTTHPV